ncbi:MAG: hypothetical protein ACQEWV_20475 [Bacillota bacterium]
MNDGKLNKEEKKAKKREKKAKKMEEKQVKDKLEIRNECSKKD